MIYDRLLATAIDHFGRHGFEGASTRAIAAASDTAMSSITYHFGGKEGLYLAAADYIAGRIADIQAPAVATARAASIGSPEQATEVMLVMLESFARMMLAPESSAWSGFIVREQQQPTAAFDRLYEGGIRDLVDTFTSLIRTARPDLDDRQARMTGILLFGQALILRVGLASVCRVLDVERIDAPTAEALLARLRAQSLCILSEKPA